MRITGTMIDAARRTIPEESERPGPRTTHTMIEAAIEAAPADWWPEHCPHCKHHAPVERPDVHSE